MKISQIVEREDGSATFQGNITGPELAFVVELGINTLMEAGALPFASTANINIASIMESETDLEQ